MHFFSSQRDYFLQLCYYFSMGTIKIWFHQLSRWSKLSFVRRFKSCHFDSRYFKFNVGLVLSFGVMLWMRTCQREKKECILIDFVESHSSNLNHSNQINLQSLLAPNHQKATMFNLKQKFNSQISPKVFCFQLANVVLVS